jgi:plastocyanin
MLWLFAAVALAQAADGAIHNVSVGPTSVFSPSTVNIAVGDTVRWTRISGYHRVVADDGSFESPGGPVSWGTYERVFNSAGTFEYYCDQHSTADGNAMNGVVVVTGGGGGGGAGSLRFSSGSASVGEGAGQITLTVQRTGGDDGAVSVQYSTSNGSASAPGDYAQTSGTLNWADNDDDSKTFQVPIADDGTQESSESFSVTLSNASGGASVGSPGTVTVTITDDDGGGGGGAGTIRFTQASISAGEAAGTVTLTAQRTGGTTGAVGVSYATANGSAGTPSDYAAVASTLSWADGDGANKSFNVTLVNDAETEGDETFTATLSSPTGGASLGSPATSTVTIVDNDTDCVPSTCTSDTNSLCLAGGSGTAGRFRIRVTWTNFAGESGQGVALEYTADSGFFYFFQPEVLELLVKIVNGCGLNDAYWFFNAAASNVGLVYTVTDLQTCETRTVTNPVGVFASGGNINFFPNCP